MFINSKSKATTTEAEILEPMTQVARRLGHHLPGKGNEAIRHRLPLLPTTF